MKGYIFLTLVFIGLILSFEKAGASEKTAKLKEVDSLMTAVRASPEQKDSLLLLLQNKAVDETTTVIVSNLLQVATEKKEKIPHGLLRMMVRDVIYRKNHGLPNFLAEKPPRLLDNLTKEEVAFLNLKATNEDFETMSRFFDFEPLLRKYPEIEKILSLRGVILQKPTRNPPIPLLLGIERTIEDSSLISAEVNKDPKKPLFYNLIRAMIVAESMGVSDAISSTGAGGKMQLMPKTAAQYGCWDVTDPTQNITAGCKYLRDLSYKFKETRGNGKKVLVGWNWGQNRNLDGTWPEETQIFLHNVRGIKQILDWIEESEKKLTSYNQ